LKDFGVAGFVCGNC